jgi:hypothetical protein
MGDAASNFSTLSFVGKVHDNPKPYGNFTAGKGTLSEQDLADFELKMLKLVHEMAEKISREQVERARKSSEE